MLEEIDRRNDKREIKNINMSVAPDALYASKLSSILHDACVSDIIVQVLWSLIDHLPDVRRYQESPQNRR